MYQIQAGKRLVWLYVVQGKYFICQLCTIAFKQYIYVFCSSDCDSADADDEETVDATEIQEI